MGLGKKEDFDLEKWRGAASKAGQFIRDSGLNVLPADNLDDAAQKIVKAVKGS